jgi:hypothetical protein
MITKVLALCAMAVLVAMAGPAQAGSIQTGDSTFNVGDWALSQFFIGDGDQASATQVLTGGNPDAYRRIRNVVAPAPSASTFSAILGAHIYTAFTYNPAATGAITSVSYSEDVNCFPPNCFGDGNAAFFAVLQNDEVYVASSGVTGSGNFWHQLALNGLTAANFFLLDGSDDFIDPSAHPDFTESGDPIRFGFARANSTCVSCGGYTLDSGIDNWRVTVNFQDPPTDTPSDDGPSDDTPSVPAPGTLVLIGAALGALGALRRFRA